MHRQNPTIFGTYKVHKRQVWGHQTYFNTSLCCPASSHGCQYDTARIAVRRCLLSIDISCQQGAPLHAAAVVVTDGRTLYRFIEPALHTMRAVSKSPILCRALLISINKRTLVCLGTCCAVERRTVVYCSAKHYRVFAAWECRLRFAFINKILAS